MKKLLMLEEAVAKSQRRWMRLGKIASLATTFDFGH